MNIQEDSHTHVHLIAHRGWSRYFPENSLPAFAAAVAAGADEIEFDVRVSSDHVPFICHDRNTSRVSDLNGNVSSFSSQELKKARIRVSDGQLLEGLGFATLTETLTLLGNRIGMNVHVKELGSDDVSLWQIKEYVERLGLRRIYIAGYAEVLQASQRVCPDIPRCCLENDGNGEMLLKNALELGCQRLQFRAHCYRQEDVDNALQSGLVTNMYFADDPEEARDAIDSGILGLLTNDIGTIRTYLKLEGVLTK
jgi:glycerophosphoryl diester phosphodiesterase